jgi:hypothetical protein
VAKGLGTIFVSYRRDDSAAHAGRLSDRLVQEFGQGRIFVDVDGIAPGENFQESISYNIEAADIVFAVIGRRWTASVDARGSRRLDDPNDFVRLEIATALARSKRVIPVLVAGAAMPQEKDLPDNLKALAVRQAVEIRDARFHADVALLIQSVRDLLQRDHAGAAAQPATQPAAAQSVPIRRHWFAMTTSILGWSIACALVLLLGLGAKVYFFDSADSGPVGKPYEPYKPAPAQEPVKAAPAARELRAELVFEDDSPRLTEEGRNRLDDLIAIVQKERYRIGGATLYVFQALPDGPTKARVEALAVARRNEIWSRLKSKGIDVERILTLTGEKSSRQTKDVLRRADLVLTPE